jgi:hypothetical protein
MRKFALLLAASLLVAAPLAMSSTDTYAAAAKAKKVAAKGAKGGAESGDPNTAFVRALGDLGAQLSQPNTGAPKAAKATKGKSKRASKKSGKKSKKA